MTRLRIGHSNLSKTLHIIGKHLTVLCEHCQVVAEIVEHILVNSRKYTSEKRT